MPFCIRSIISKCKNLPALQEVVRPLQLDERMIALAAAISIDFDYFSQHSHGPGSVSHPVEHLMLRVIPLCHIKASVALGEHVAGHLGTAASEVQICELVDGLCLVASCRMQV